MNTFHHELGHEAGSTMTVSELKAALDEYPNNMPVFAEWEGVNGYVKKENFSIGNVHKGMESEACQCLVIWVEEY